MNQKKNRNFILLSQVLIKSRTRSTYFASVVQIEEPSGMCIILQWLSDITAKPTFISYLTQRYKFVDSTYNEFIVILSNLLV